MVNKVNTLDVLNLHLTHVDLNINLTLTQAPGPDYDQASTSTLDLNGGTTTRHPPRPVTLIPDFDLQDASLEHDSSSILSTDIRASPSTSIIQHFTNSQQVFAFVDVGARGSGSLRHMEGPDVKEAEIAGNHKGTAGGAARSPPGRHPTTAGRLQKGLRRGARRAYGPKTTWTKWPDQKQEYWSHRSDRIKTTDRDRDRNQGGGRGGSQGHNKAVPILGKIAPGGCPP
ncbi:hypothetical protein V8E36_005280 [Tilletia maclaganii]